jgi:hypothetical protein
MRAASGVEHKTGLLICGFGHPTTELAPPALDAAPNKRLTGRALHHMLCLTKQQAQHD